MPTLVSDPQPVEFEALLERRRQLGLDRRDELWNGVYRMNPPPSIEHQMIAHQLGLILDPLARAAGLVAVVQEFALGDRDDYVVPDGGFHHPGARGVWHATAPLAVEILSPDDDTWQKLGFYAAHHVDELLIVDPQQRKVQWLGLEAGGEYRPVEHSRLIALGPVELAGRIDWPQ